MANKPDHMTEQELAFIRDYAESGSDLSHGLARVAVHEFDGNILRMFRASHSHIEERILEPIYQQHKDDISRIAKSEIDYDMKPNEAPTRRYDLTCLAISATLRNLIKRLDELI